mgnify:CR=1 FL=1
MLSPDDPETKSNKKSWAESWKSIKSVKSH